jgi:ubiquitin carboxyl-terminal hydrolase 8
MDNEIIVPSAVEAKEKTSPDTEPDFVTRGLSGLSNLGNTCYMNSVLQALSATKQLLGYMLCKDTDMLEAVKHRIIENIHIEHKKKKQDVPDTEPIIDMKEVISEAKSTITIKLQEVFETMWKHNCEVAPKRFKRCVDTKLNFFGGGAQHDAQEFLTALLDKIHDDTKSNVQLSIELDASSKAIDTQLTLYEEQLSAMKQAKNIEGVREFIMKMYDMYKANHNEYLEVMSIRAWSNILKTSQYSIINDIFSGMTMSTITCNVCKIPNHRFERYDIMTLNLPEVLDINVQGYTIQELLTNYFKNEEMTNTNKYNCNVCNIKNDATKEQTIYQLPNVLVFMIKKYQKFNERIIKTNTKIAYEHQLDMTPYVIGNNKNTKVYELYASIRHSGGINGGHYYAYIKNPLNSMWYLHDDDDVYNVDDSEVLKSNGYILFYRQIE